MRFLEILGLDYIRRRIKSKHACLFNVAYRLLAPPEYTEELLVKENTDIVIEGFPRCANTFAVVAFTKAQSYDINIAHHTHASSHALMGLQLQKPVLILIRDPEQAIRSLVVRDKNYGIKSAIMEYIIFYETILEHIDEIVVADFSEITTEFNRVIKAVNKVFHTDFKQLDNLEPMLSDIYREIDEINNIYGKELVSSTSRPTNERNRLYKSLDINSECESEYWAKARKIYTNVLACRIPI